ncbi:MarR family winged helix-turn-helix transcriptional regulator [Burkholderia sp. A1]|uniref:MarR family winged helix-turn-helix transcriptional regulator n=1 Tax=Burkholderia sp. A1 TaxID=148446 RepID=UPI00046A4C77|nr:MarR family winged helix-turn-helix transcriptional regulator [Burkholderia sp. A1]
MGKKLVIAPAPEAGATAAARDLPEPPACINTALRRAARRLGNLYDDAFDALGLKATQVGLLAEIERLTAAGDGVPPALQDLAARLSIQVSALTHALRPPIRDGLVELWQDERDGRTKRAALTPAGQACLREAYAHWSEVNRRVEAVLGKEPAAALRALADHVASDDFLAAYREAEAEGSGPG